MDVYTTLQRFAVWDVESSLNLPLGILSSMKDEQRAFQPAAIRTTASLDENEMGPTVHSNVLSNGKTLIYNANIKERKMHSALRGNGNERVG